MSYSILWLVMAVVMGAIALFPESIYIIGRKLHIWYPPALFFLVAGTCLVAILFHVSMVISVLSYQNINLTQELALLRHQLEEQKKNQGSAIKNEAE